MLKKNKNLWTSSNPLQIWVSKGVYIPADTAFVMVENVKTYGGFNGTESQLTQRNWVTNISKLNGSNLNKIIVNYNNNLTLASILDGFTIDCRGDIHLNRIGIKNYNSSPFVKNCNFISDTQSTERYMYNYHSNMKVISCTFDSCNSRNDYGSVMYNDNCTITLHKCKLTNNVNYTKGGAIYNKNTTINIDSCEFKNNFSYSGAGIYNDSADFIITNTVFSQNKSNSYQGGGGIYNKDSRGKIENCTFDGNSSFGGYGSGIANYNTSPEIKGCVFNKNTSTGQGGTIANKHLASPVITY